VRGGMHGKEGSHDPRHPYAHGRLADPGQPGPQAHRGNRLPQKHAVHGDFFHSPAEAAPRLLAFGADGQVLRVLWV